MATSIIRVENLWYLQRLQSIDNDSYSPLDEGSWSHLMKGGFVWLLSMNAVPVGYLAAAMTDKPDELIIHRVVVARAYRRMGVSRELLKRATDECRVKHKVIKKLVMLVPEHACRPDSADRVDQWLLATGFNPTGIEDRDAVEAYGKTWDVFRFVREVPNAT